ncbi:hypothetical protein F2Q69_00025363 [Brassica cretica]|uniref:Uncharacterized protein n=1 Tax=Brassica cretica TaxID=69181 RepID=A0A8S9QIV9_BRACR|nr:hypothetical protein F2Q69_00025363 [Brassica cretica]
MQEISAWINKNLQGKEKKKQETIDFGGILGSSEFDLMLFMLTAIGVKIPEGMELTKEMLRSSKTMRKPEKFYEEEKARLNAESASKHPVEERKAEHTKSEDYENLADDAEKLKEDEEEARLLIAAVVLFMGLKKLGL